MEKALFDRKRNAYDIFARILRITRSGASKTHIMYLANLSFTSLEVYLKILIRLRLLEENRKKPRIYLTSEKGMKYLAAFRELKKTIS